MKSFLDMSGIIHAFITQTSDIFYLSYDEKVCPYLNNNKVPDAAFLISSRSHVLQLASSFRLKLNNNII